MVGPLLLAAWANAGSVMSSFRKASYVFLPSPFFAHCIPSLSSSIRTDTPPSQYAQPPPYSNTSVSLSPISSGTYINATHASLTFVCAGCVDDVLSFSPFDTTTTMAYAVSYTSPQTPGSANASLSFHGAGFGE